MLVIENIGFKMYLCFIWIEKYRIFYFSQRILAKHHTLSSWCRFSVAGLDRVDLNS